MRHDVVRAKRERGFSLLEIIVVLGLIALSLALAGPDLFTFTRGRDAERAARQVQQELKMARWRAVASGRRTRVSTLGPSGGIVSGYIVEREEGGQWVPEGGRRDLPTGVELRTTGPGAKIFNPDGTCSPGSIVLAGGGCRYRLSLNPATGRIRLWRGEREIGP